MLRAERPKENAMTWDRYRGCRIQATPLRLPDGSGWISSCAIIGHAAGRTNFPPVGTPDVVFSTEEEAIRRSLDLARLAIDRKLGPR
jgi:hypothetical protein